MTAVLPNDLRSPFFRRQRWSRVLNTTGTVIPPFSVVLITSVSSTSGEIVFTVRQPNAAAADFNWNGYLVTGPIAIGVSDTNNEGYATDLSEPGFVRYDSGSPTIGQVWGPKHGQYTLSSGYYGFEILGGATTAASNGVVVARWIGTHTVLGKIDDASVTLGGTCTVSVFNGATGTTDTTMNITSVLNRGTALTSLSSPYCGVARNGNVPILMWVAC